MKRNLADTLLFRRRWWQHILFWVVAAAVLLNIFSTSSTLQKIDVIYTLLFLLPLGLIVYLNLYLLIPGILGKERYLLYALLLPALAVAGAVILYLLFDRWIDYLLPGYYFISYYSIPQLMIYTGSFLVLTTLLKLSRSWFQLLRMERMASHYQLRTLQSQINPHFLLNSLQTIYALALEKSETAPGVILLLSDILKYTLYDTEKNRVSLESEISIVEKYIQMHRYRFDPQRVSINMEVKGDPSPCEVSPLLFLPFIENSFKHGVQGTEGKAFIEIRFRIESQNLCFSIRNNCGNSDAPEWIPREGIGIRNTSRRLALLYPGKHHLASGREGNIFSVELTLDLSP